MTITFNYILRRSGRQLVRSMKPSSSNGHSYEHWTNQELIARLVDLDDRIRTKYPNAKDTEPILPAVTSQKPFNFSAHPVRKIAFKLCYTGSEYSGLQFQKTPTPLPTVEEILFQALAKTKLVDPDKGFDGCGWERSGRTDRGVSAAGQVVSLWIRSAAEGQQPSTHQKSEFNYIRILNGVLPPTIRIIAWSPVASPFSARYNCRQRHYKYFFSSGGLDLSLMRDGAQRLIGEHDFRNLCTLDPAKQITNFHRRILRADISPLAGQEDLCVLDLVGTAFLYHQVRHIMAILFLIGTGLEHPSVISSLLNVNPMKLASLTTKEDDPPLEVVDRKPEYLIADGLPLMLWDSGYAESDVQWRTAADDDAREERQNAGSDLYDQLHAIHDRSTIHTVLDAHFFSAVAVYHPGAPPYFPRSQSQVELPHVVRIPLGGGIYRRQNYKPLLRIKRLDTVEEANARWMAGPGGRKEERRRLNAEGDE